MRMLWLNGAASHNSLLARVPAVVRSVHLFGGSVPIDAAEWHHLKQTCHQIALYGLPVSVAVKVSAMKEPATSNPDKWL